MIILLIMSDNFTFFPCRGKGWPTFEKGYCKKVRDDLKKKGTLPSKKL